MKKAEKAFYIDELTEELKSATSAVLIDYTGLSVKMQQDLKKKLKEVGAELKVIKNTLFSLAGKAAESPKEILNDEVLSGPNALVITESDPIAPLQVLAKFAQSFEVPSFKVGLVDGNFRDKSTLETLSRLPSKDILSGQLLGSLSNPLYGITGVLQGNLQKLIYILKAKGGE